MSTAVIHISKPLAKGQIQHIRRAARRRAAELASKATSANTKAAYAADWGHFERWCKALDVSSLPASVEVVAEYVAALVTMTQSSKSGRGKRKTAKTGYSVATITRRLATISLRHRKARLENPCTAEAVREVMRGIRREVGTAQRKKGALLTENFRALQREPERLIEMRDRALLLVGFAGAFRRSELAALDVSDCEFDDARRVLTIHLRRSKTDQEGEGQSKHILAFEEGSVAFYAVSALRRWLEAADISSGAVFRGFLHRGGKLSSERLSSASVSLIVKRYAAKLGLDAAQFGGHSLRVGHVTQALMNKQSPREIMKTTGHKSYAMVFRYDREIDARTSNSSASLGKL